MKIDCYLTSDVRSFPVLESSQFNMMGANFLSSIVNIEQKNCKTKSIKFFTFNSTTSLDSWPS